MATTDSTLSILGPVNIVETNSIRASAYEYQHSEHPVGVTIVPASISISRQSHRQISVSQKGQISRLEMEDAIEQLFSVGITNQRLAIDVIDALTSADVSRQEVVFNVELVANEGLYLAGREPTKSLLKATGDDFRQIDTVSSDRKVPRSFFASACRQLAAIACYFAAIYAVGLCILANEIGIAAAIPLAVKTCAGKSLVAALIGPWIQRLTGATTL